jgi:hypothetical protein
MSLRTLSVVFGLISLVACGSSEPAPSPVAQVAPHATLPVAARSAIHAPAPAPALATRGALHAPPAKTSPSKAVSTTVGVPGGSPAASKSSSGIVSTGANSWSVPKSVVTRYTSNPNALGSQAAVQQVDSGWRIKSVKSGTDVSAMGVKTGDVITRVNGYSVDGMLNTWWAAQHLKNQPTYRVSVLRAGKPVTLKYQVI